MKHSSIDGRAKARRSLSDDAKIGIFPSTAKEKTLNKVGNSLQLAFL